MENSLGGRAVVVAMNLSKRTPSCHKLKGVGGTNWPLFSYVTSSAKLGAYKLFYKLWKFKLGPAL